MIYEGNHKLGELFSSRKKKGKPGLPTLSVTLTNGLVDRDSLERKTDTNLSEHQHLLAIKGDIAYNMMRMWQGASGLAERDGIVSPAYIVLEPSEKIDSLYASYLFKTQRMIYLFWAYSYGLTSDRLRLYFNDFAKIPVNIPSVREQTKIAQILSTWDKAIATTEKLIANSKVQKKALMQQLLTGKRRLSGFCEKWKYSSFNELYRVANDKSKQVGKSKYSLVGNTPIVDQGKSLVAGYVDTNSPYEDIPVIIFGDHTRAVKWIDFPFALGADGTQALKPTAILDPLYSYFLLSNVALPDLGYSRHMRELKQREFFHPTDIAEQSAIASIIWNSEKMINNLEHQSTHLYNQKKALMQQLLTGKRRVKLDPAA